MLRLTTSNGIPFVLLYQPDGVQPKITKAIVEDDKYFLVNPSDGDINKYSLGDTKNLTYHKVSS